MFAVPIVYFGGPISEKIRANRIENKQNAVARKYACRLTDFLNKSSQFDNSIREINDFLRTHYGNIIQGKLASYALDSYTGISNTIQSLRYEIDKPKKYYGEFRFLMENFKIAVLDVFERQLRYIEVCVHEITAIREKTMATHEKPIDKNLESTFEAFRERYNDFIKDINDFSHNINRETGTWNFPEHLEYLKRW